MTTLTLAYPPSANRYWRMANNRIYRSEDANKYRDYITLLCHSLQIPMLRGDISVRLTFYRPAKMGDLDNRLKIVLDALQGHAYENDSQITEIHAVRNDDKKNPRVEVQIMAVSK